LKQTTAGRRVLQETAKELQEEKCRACELAIHQRPKVLCVLRRLGDRPGVEVYAERGAQVRIEELVDTFGSPSLEIAAEEVLEAQLPRNWKHLANGKPESMVWRGLTPKQRLRALESVAWLNELKGWHEQYIGTKRKKRT
jgi:hypothetical protein